MYLPVSLTVASNYSSRAIREHLRKRGIRAVILIPADQRGHRLRRGSRDGRPPAFDRETYTQRNAVERCINRLKQWRGIATRYEKTATVYRRAESEEQVLRAARTAAGRIRRTRRPSDWRSW